MIREERVRLMTKAAIYEQQESRKALLICRYRRRDYIFVQLLKTVLLTLIAAVIFTVLWFFYQPESFLDELKLRTLVLLFAGVCAAALLLVCVFLVISFVIHSRRYDCCREKNRQYSQLLKRLYHLYEQEEKTKNAAGGRKTDDAFSGSQGKTEELIQ